MDLAELVAGPLREVLAAVPPGSVESDRLQDTAGELINGVTPALRAYYGGTRDLIPEAVVEGLLPLLDLQGDNRTILAALREELADAATRRDLRACNRAVFKLYGLNREERSTLEGDGE